MIKKINTIVTCPHCSHSIETELYSSISGNTYKNIDLILSDKINIAHCPNCKQITKVDHSLLYKNPYKKISVLWEPNSDQSTEEEIQECKTRSNNYLENTIKIKEWDKFKEKIIDLEEQKRFGRISYLVNLILSGLLVKFFFLGAKIEYQQDDIESYIYCFIFTIIPASYILSSAIHNRCADIGISTKIIILPTIIFLFMPLVIIFFLALHSSAAPDHFLIISQSFSILASIWIFGCNIVLLFKRGIFPNKHQRAKKQTRMKWVIQKLVKFIKSPKIQTAIFILIILFGGAKFVLDNEKEELEAIIFDRCFNKYNKEIAAEVCSCESKAIFESLPNPFKAIKYARNISKTYNSWEQFYQEKDPQFYNLFSYNYEKCLY